MATTNDKTAIPDVMPRAVLERVAPTSEKPAKPAKGLRRTIEQQIAELQAKQAMQLGLTRSRALLDGVRTHLTAKDFELAAEMSKTLTAELIALAEKQANG